MVLWPNHTAYINHFSVYDVKDSRPLTLLSLLAAAVDGSGSGRAPRRSDASLKNVWELMIEGSEGGGNRRHIMDDDSWMNSAGI